MKNYFDIKDKVAVITGGSSGLGVQFAKAFASQGAKVALFARREEKLKAVADEIKEIEELHADDLDIAPRAVSENGEHAEQQADQHRDQACRNAFHPEFFHDDRDNGLHQ